MTVEVAVLGSQVPTSPYGLCGRRREGGGGGGGWGGGGLLCPYPCTHMINVFSIFT